MTHPKKEPSKIRAIMKISAQLIGPSDEQSKLELDISDYKGSKGQLILPPYLNPIVYQYSVKIFRGRNIDIDTYFCGLKDTTNPCVRVTLGEYSLETDIKYNTANPEFNETLYMPITYPSMTQYIKFELLSKQVGGFILLATENMHIQFLEQNKIYGQYMWVNFYTSLNVQSAIGRKMVEGLLPGNYFGGRLLVKIEKYRTKNPKPISKSKMLVNRSGEEGIDEITERKGSLISKLNQVNNQREGKDFECYEQQPKVRSQKLEIDFELYMAVNMPNDKSGNYKIIVTISRTTICEFTPTHGLSGANDFHFYQSKKGIFDFDYIEFLEDQNHIISPQVKERPWLYQLPDIIVTYYCSGKVVSYLIINPEDLYFRQNLFKGTELRKSEWQDPLTLNPDQRSDQFDKFFPKYYQMDYDPTCNQNGCFYERPGYIQFNANLMDRGYNITINPHANDNVSSYRKDDLHCMLEWIKSDYLYPNPEEFKLYTYIFQCNNLPPADYNGLSDPYCRIFHNHSETQTKSIIKSLNPQFYEYKTFEVKKYKCKFIGEQGIVHRLTPPMNIEVWDQDNSLSDGFSADDILCSVKIDLYDHDWFKQKRKLDIYKIELDTEMQKAVDNQDIYKMDYIQKSIEKLEVSLIDLNKIQIIYDDSERKDKSGTGPLYDHYNFKPKKLKLKDWIRGDNSEATIYVKNVIVYAKDHHDVDFYAEYVNYNFEFYCIGMSNLKNYGMIAVKQPYLRLNMKDLLPEKYKMMTKDIDTINAKGICNNKSLYSIIETNIMLPKDSYLFPTLGVDVKDNFLGLFNFGNDIWANFNIDVINHELGNLKQAHDESLEYEKNIAIREFMKLQIYNASKTNYTYDKKVNNVQEEIKLKSAYRPIKNRKNTKLINDLYVSISEKRKLVFKSEEIKRPNLYEAIQGKIKIFPVWKKDGNIWVEMTEYPLEKLEPIGYGYSEKHYRHVIRYDKVIKRFSDTGYGNISALSTQTIKGYDGISSLDVGKFVYYAIVSREYSESNLNDQDQHTLDKYHSKLKATSLKALSMNYEYDIRLYILRGIDLYSKDEDSESDPYLVIFTEQIHYDLRSESQEDESNPHWYKIIRFRARIPEQNTLTIQVWDKDFICDEMIGQIQINMLDRALSTNYMKIKHKPVEDRDLYDEISTQPKGRIRYIFEMYRTTQDVIEPVPNENVGAKSKGMGHKWFGKNKLTKMKLKSKFKSKKDSFGNVTTTKTLSEDEILNLHPIITIARLPTRKFSIRLIIWNGENVPSMDIGGTSDVYVKAWLATQYGSKVVDYEIQSTDIHWACGTGSPNWNYRMTWDYVINSEEEQHALYIQMYDKDIFSYDEMIGSVQLDFTNPGLFSYMENIRSATYVIPDENDHEKQLLERVKYKGAEGDMMEIFMNNKNKNGEKYYRGSLFITFHIVPEDAALQITVGRGRDQPNNDPFLPEPTGRMSIMSGPWASLFGGMFVIGGTLKTYLINLLIAVIVVALTVLTIYQLASSFGGTFLSMMILDD